VSGSNRSIVIPVFGNLPPGLIASNKEPACILKGFSYIVQLKYSHER